MVRTSYRQALLNELADDVLDAYIASAVLSDSSLSDSSTTTLDGTSTESSSSDSSDNDEDADMILDAYQEVSGQRYAAERVKVLRRAERMIDLLLYWERRNAQRFRGQARMKPAAFRDLVERLRYTTPFQGDGTLRSWDWVAEKVAVAFYRLGRSGNGAGARDVAQNCGCSEGSVVNWTRMTVDGLNEISDEVVTFATEDERQSSSAWVQERTGCDAWGRGWACVDGTQIDLAWRPALNPREYYNYKRWFSLNVAVVILPHSLRIIEVVVGFPGSAQDSRVWATQSRILAKPRLHLDEGEFIWTDGGYGFNPFTVGPFTHKAADKCLDIRKFNYTLSSVRVRVEHAIDYLKNRFQCLKGYRGNIYREDDHTTSSKVTMACIVAHTFASRYDSPEDVAEYLQGTPDQLDKIVDDLQRFRATQEPYRRARRVAQREFEAQAAREKARLRASQLDKLRKDRALDLREEMFVELFSDLGLPFRDTNAESRRQERSIASLAGFLREQQQAARNRRRLGSQASTSTGTGSGSRSRSRGQTQS